MSDATERLNAALGPPGSTLRLTMKKTFLVLPVLLLTGCASDLSMGPIGLMDGLFGYCQLGGSGVKPERRLRPARSGSRSRTPIFERTSP